MGLVSVCVLGTASNGQVPSAQTPSPNQQVIDAWRQLTGENSPAPQLVTQPDGSARLEWHGSFALDAYGNDIALPAAPTENTSPLRTGNFAKAVLVTDVKFIRADGTISFLQSGLVSSNDRAVISGYPHQITNLQFGQSGPEYEVRGGDAALAYSSLGSTLGFRGIAVNRRFENWTVSAFGGVIADSWAALANRSPVATGAVGFTTAPRLLRDVAGAKIERSLGPGFKAYVTFQGFSDQAGNQPPETQTQTAARSQVGTAGITFQNQNWTANAELAGSRYAEDESTPRKGSGEIFDLTYRAETWSARAGFHDITPAFVSLSQAVPPGLREGYAGFDWSGVSWLTLGSDLRQSTSRTLGFSLPQIELDSAQPPANPVLSISTVSRTQTAAGRANLNLASVVPGLNLGVQASTSSTDDANGGSALSTRSASMSYSTQSWTFNANGSRGMTRSAGTPQYDSANHDVQLSLGHNLVSVDAGGSTLWSLNVAVMGGRHQQLLMATGEASNSYSMGLTLSGQWTRVGQANISWSHDVTGIASGQTSSQNGQQTGQLIGAKSLATNVIQADATFLFGKQHSLKLYAQEAMRNAGEVTLQTRERSAGAQVTLVW
ncbi:MAG: hypothetical protein ABI905_15205 [Betaproteobacteria bacterium]